MRDAKPSDLAALTLLEREAFHDPWSVEQIAGHLAQPGSFTLLETARSGETAGYAAFQVVIDEAELLRICVLPFQRRQGIAQTLLTEGLSRLAARGVRSVHLEVRADNEPAIALYRRLGFELVGERRT